MDLFSYLRGLDEGDNEDGIISWMLASRIAVASAANALYHFFTDVLFAAKVEGVNTDFYVGEKRKDGL